MRALGTKTIIWSSPGCKSISFGLMSYIKLCSLFNAHVPFVHMLNSKNCFVCTDGFRKKMELYFYSERIVHAQQHFIQTSAVLLSYLLHQQFYLLIVCLILSFIFHTCYFLSFSFSVSLHFLSFLRLKAVILLPEWQEWLKVLVEIAKEDMI